MSLIVEEGLTKEPVTVKDARLQCRMDEDLPDELLCLYIAAARQYAEEFLRRSIAQAEVVEGFCRFPCKCMFLAKAPVKEVLAVEYTDTNGDTVTVDPDLYSVGGDPMDGAFLVTNQGQRWPSNFIAAPDVIRVRYRVGWDPCPAPVRLAILHLIDHAYEHRGATLPSALAAENRYVENLLFPYRNVSAVDDCDSCCGSVH